jgi:hypothetical protein
MSESAIANGVYMRAMTRRESIAHLAALAVDHQIAAGEYSGAVETANAILTVNPRDVYVMVKAATAYGHLLRMRFFEKYPTANEIPQEEFEDYQFYSSTNAKLFETAESLGWRPVE